LIDMVVPILICVVLLLPFANGANDWWVCCGMSDHAATGSNFGNRFISHFVDTDVIGLFQ